jgi:hypothetical protein
MLGLARNMVALAAFVVQVNVFSDRDILLGRLVAKTDRQATSESH